MRAPGIPGRVPSVSPRFVLLVAVGGVLAAGAPVRAETAAIMPDHVHRTIQRHDTAIRRCYDRGVRESGQLGGKLVVRFRVDRSGRTRTVAIVAGESTLHHRAVERCVKRVFRSMKFRRAARATWYRSPIVFGASQSG